MNLFYIKIEQGLFFFNSVYFYITMNYQCTSDVILLCFYSIYKNGVYWIIIYSNSMHQIRPGTQEPFDFKLSLTCLELQWRERFLVFFKCSHSYCTALKTWNTECKCNGYFYASQERANTLQNLSGVYLMTWGWVNISRIFISVCVIPLNGGRQARICARWICRSVLRADFHNQCVKQRSPLTSNASLYPVPFLVSPTARYFLFLLCRQHPIQICKVKDCDSELEFSPSSLEYETSAHDTFQLLQVAHSLILFIPRALNKGKSLPKTRSPLFQGWDLPAHQFSVCIWVSARIQRHCKHCVARGVSGIRIVSPFL